MVVVGGGTSGAIAAIASARNGADTLVVESEGFLGGTSTFGYPFLGFFNGRGEQVVAGLPQEVVDRLVELKASPGHVRGGTWSTPERPMTYEFSLTPYDPEILKYVLLRMAEEAGVRFLFHATLLGTIVEGEILKGIEVVTKSGNIRIMGRTFVDGTGDADLAFMAGAPFELGSTEGLLQNVTLHFRMTNVNAERLVEALQREDRVLGKRYLVYPSRSRKRARDSNRTGSSTLQVTWSHGMTLKVALLLPLQRSRKGREITGLI